MTAQKRDHVRARRNRLIVIFAALGLVAVAGGVAVVGPSRRSETSRSTEQRAAASTGGRTAALAARRAGYVAGDVLTYTLSHEAAVDMAEGGRFYHLSASGDWVVRVVDVAPSYVRLAASIERAVLKSTQARPGREHDYRAIEQELAQPMFFTLDVSGKVTDARFGSATSRSAIDLLRSIVALSQHSVAERDDTSWQAFEPDATGRYVAAYKQLGTDTRLSKQKLRYSEVNATNASIDSEFSVEVLASEGDLTLDERGILEALHVRDVVRTRSQMLPDMTATTRLTLTRSGVARDLVAANTLRAQAEALAPLALYDSPPTKSETAAIDRAKVAGRKLGDFMRDFAELPSLEDSTFEERDKSRRLFIELAALFRLDDAAIDQAMAVIAEGSKLSPVLWDAFASAGTPKAQAALRELIANPRFGLEDRRMQMIGLSFVTTPVPETVEFLFARVDDAEQGQQARFGIGTALNHLRGKNDEHVATGVQRLAAELERADKPQDISDYLRAFGNAGVGEAKEHVSEYIEHDNPSVRAAAANALRFMPGEDVLATLIRVITTDPEPMVRVNAIQAAGERAPDKALLEAVFDASVGDANKGVRDQATDTLNRWGANYPPIGEALAAFEQANETAQREAEASQSESAEM